MRLPGAKPFSHRNTAPMFYAARKLLGYKSDDAQEMLEYTQAMTERFKVRTWSVPLAFGRATARFPKCGTCCAHLG